MKQHSRRAGTLHEVVERTAHGWRHRSSLQGPLLLSRRPSYNSAPYHTSCAHTHPERAVDSSWIVKVGETGWEPGFGWTARRSASFCGRGYLMWYVVKEERSHNMSWTTCWRTMTPKSCSLASEDTRLSWGVRLNKSSQTLSGEDTLPQLWALHMVLGGSEGFRVRV